MTVLLYIFLACFVVQLFFYLIVFRKLAFYNPASLEPNKNLPPVSVIICAKNEELNIKKYLPEILSQEYPEFEVIVVNDDSTDNTLEVLRDFESKNNRLKVIDLPDNPGKLLGKKEALLTGFKAAKYDYVLLTDADCQPAGKNWITNMISGFSENTQIVLGYAPFFPQRGILNRFIRYDNFYTSMQYLSLALSGIPYMGVGRNIMYRASVVGGSSAFEKHDRLLSGDDDLLVNEMATGQNTEIMIIKEAHVFSMPKKSLSDWIIQKRRHVSTGIRYKLSHQAILGVLNLSQIGFNVAFLALLLCGVQMMLALLLFIIKNIIQFIISGKIMTKLGLKDLVIFSPLGDLIMSAFLVSLGMLSLIKLKKWK